jgi:hypothetical protein
MYGGDNDEVGVREVSDEHFGGHGEQPSFHPDFGMKADELDGEKGWPATVGEVAVDPAEDLVGPFDVGDAAIAFRHEDRDVFHIADARFDPIVLIR